jgi:hypothetical protein
MIRLFRRMIIRINAESRLGWVLMFEKHPELNKDVKVLRRDGSVDYGRLWLEMGGGRAWSCDPWDGKSRADIVAWREG